MPTSMERYVHGDGSMNDFTGIFTRRQYLVRRLMLDGTNMWLAIEAVATTSLSHPERDYDEEKTWDEWEKAADE